MSDVNPPLPLDEFIQALRAHAAAVEHLSSPDASPESIDPAIDALRAAALAYDEAVYERSGLADIFADLADDELDEFWDDDDLLEPDAESESETGLEVEDGVGRITITGRWDFLVRDPSALQELAAQRLREEVADIDDETLEDHAGSPGSALASLISYDGRFDYPGLDDAGAQWSVGPTDRTLAEMTGQEREDYFDDSIPLPHDLTD